MLPPVSLAEYSETENQQIQKDLKHVREFTFDAAKPNTAESIPDYIATAGGPGSAKTTTLETFLKTNKLNHFVYADPDQVSLQHMSYTYRQARRNLEIAEAKSPHDAFKSAYNKWRTASNYICHQMLEHAFAEKYSVAHGTTSTHPEIASLYAKIKKLGYRITLLLCYSHDKTRENAIEKREHEQGFVQTDPKDVISKGINFPKQFNSYFEFADEIFLYWNDPLIPGKLPKPCAQLVKNEKGFTLTILNTEDWIQFCKKYLEDIAQYNFPICETFKRYIPTELLIQNSPTFATSAQALPLVGLLNTRPQPTEASAQHTVADNAKFEL